MKEIAIQLNGELRRVAVAPNDTLLDVLRGQLGVKTPKEGCGRGDCGACTVLLDGRAVRSCLILAVETDGQSVTTLGRGGPGRSLGPAEGFREGQCVPVRILRPGRHPVGIGLAG